MKELIIMLIAAFAIALHGEQSQLFSQRLRYKIESFCGYTFGSQRPDNIETNTVIVKLDKPFRACTRIKLGYADVTHELCSISLEGDLDGWSFASVTNEADIVRDILEEKLGLKLKRDRYGSYSFSNSHVELRILSAFQCTMLEATLQKAKRNLLCIHVKNKDVIEKDEAAKKLAHEKLMREINFSIPPEQDRDFITCSWSNQ